jgi:hypothetical protein
MKQKLIIAFLILLAAYAACRLTAYAQDPPKPRAAAPEKNPAPAAAFVLPDADQKQWAQFAAVEKQLQAEIGRVINSARNAGNDTTTAVQFLGSVKELLNQLDLTGARRELWLAKLQSERDCKGCVVSEDGKSLVSPKAPK